MYLAFLVLLFFGACTASLDELFRKYDPDEDLSTAQIIRRHGYPSESHVIVTEDGYLLTIHRMPHGRNCTKRGGKPVLLQHGFMSSSSDFVLQGPEISLGYLLADSGYDVWMGNHRGNFYSLGHISLSTDDVKYWNFTFHEMGVYDLTASVDYILNLTNHESLYFAGHSMGTTTFFAMAASRPEYGSKVKAMFALAPVAYCKHVKSPIRLLAPWANDFEFLAKYLGDGSFMPQNKIMKYMERVGCEMMQWEEEICSNMFFVIAGFDRPQFNMTLLPLILGHAPAGSSTKTIVHYAQLVNSGEFQQYNYGKLTNLIRYGTWDPPKYNLSAITTPTMLYYGDNDWLASVIDVERLYNGLTRRLGKLLIKFPGFNHIDFIYGKDVKTLIYDDMLNRLQQLERT